MEFFLCFPLKHGCKENYIFIIKIEIFLGLSKRHKEEFWSNLFSRQYVTVLKFQKTRKKNTQHIKSTNTKSDLRRRSISLPPGRMNARASSPSVSAHKCLFLWMKWTKQAIEKNVGTIGAKRNPQFLWHLHFELEIYFVVVHTLSSTPYRLRSRHFNTFQSLIASY